MRTPERFSSSNSPAAWSAPRCRSAPPAEAARPGDEGGEQEWRDRGRVVLLNATHERVTAEEVRQQQGDGEDQNLRREERQEEERGQQSQQVFPVRPDIQRGPGRRRVPEQEARGGRRRRAVMGMEQRARSRSCGGPVRRPAGPLKPARRSAPAGGSWGCPRAGTAGPGGGEKR